MPKHPSRDFSDNRQDAAFEAGREAFRRGLGPLDNPHFAKSSEIDLFDGWSDGWLSQLELTTKSPLGLKMRRWIETHMG